MGGNGSYTKTRRKGRVTKSGVKEEVRTHFAIPPRVEGHKILLSRSCYWHVKPVLNSNRSKIYLLASTRSRADLSVQIKSILFFKRHRLCRAIDLKYGQDGKLLPFSQTGEEGTHEHRIFDNFKGASGCVGRIPHDKSNTFPTDMRDHLLHKVDMFNKSHYQWEKPEDKKL